MVIGFILSILFLIVFIGGFILISQNEKLRKQVKLLERGGGRKKDGNSLKFGFDIHGVIDELPQTFRLLNNMLYDAGHEIHILTGSHITPEIKQELNRQGIKYDYLFSISDYHKHRGVNITYDSQQTPWIDDETWNKTKGEYCSMNNINLHFDDSDVYEKYFTTPYARIWTKNNHNGKGDRKRRPNPLNK